MPRSGHFRILFLSGESLLLARSALQKFRESLRGQTFCPDDPGYDEARTVPNAMID